MTDIPDKVIAVRRPKGGLMFGREGDWFSSDVIAKYERADIVADLEVENRRLRAALSMTREGVDADEAMRRQGVS